MEDNPFSPEKHRLVLEQLAQQKKKEEAFLIEGVKTIPVSQDVLNKLIWKVGEAHEIMNHHPGYDSYNRIESLKRSLEIYRKGYGDLMGNINAFGEAAKDRTLFERPRAQELKKYEIGCRKEIFSLTSSAAMLVKITRHITGKITFHDFDKVRKRSFDGSQHSFVMELRNNLNHVTFLESNWSLKNLGQEETSHFEFQTEKLLRNGDFNQEACEYILGQGEVIDVRNLFASYHSCIDAFYTWLIPEIENKLPVAVQDYQRCRKEMQANSARCWYRLLFQQIIKPKTDLYSHLHRYLTPDELEEINALPPRSKAQVDRIIEMVDEHGACDDDLRCMVYKAFLVNEK